MRLFNDLKNKLALEYEQKGYTVTIEPIIKTGLTGKGNIRWWKTDLLAEKGKEKLLLQIGRVDNPQKLSELKAKGYELRAVPFHKEHDGLFSCACGYEWLSRVEKPKSCPSCKQKMVWE